MDLLTDTNADISAKELAELLQIIEDEYHLQIRSGVLRNLDAVYPPGTLVSIQAAFLYWRYQPQAGAPITTDFFMKWPTWPLLPLHYQFRDHGKDYRPAVTQLLIRKLANTHCSFFSQSIDSLAEKGQTAVVLKSFFFCRSSCFLLLFEDGTIGWTSWRTAVRGVEYSDLAILQRPGQEYCCGS